MYSTICLLRHVIQDFVQKAVFSEIQAISVGGVTMYDKGWRHKYCFKSLQKCFRRAFYINRQNDV